MATLPRVISKIPSAPNRAIYETETGHECPWCGEKEQALVCETVEPDE